MNSKLKRTANFSETDRLLLIKIVNLYKAVIECKRTDSITWKEKEEAWQKVQTKYNSSTTGPPRAVKQLKTKYEAIKKELKKEFSKHRTYVTGTGGGEYKSPPAPKSEEEKILAETIAISIQGLQNIQDSDGIAGTSGITIRSNDVEVENESIYDWTPPNTKLLRTPINPILQGTSEITICSNDVEVENESIYDWTPPNTKLLRTPVNPILRPIVNFESNELDITYEDTTDIANVPEADKYVFTPDHTYHEIVEDIAVKKDKQPSRAKSWTSRRRPVLTKKQCLSSAGAKFETLADQKTELVALETKIAQEKLLQNQKEHEERMKILGLQRQREELKLEMIK